MSWAEEKLALRKRFRQMRRRQDRDALAAASGLICDRLLALSQLQKADRVFCYVSYGGEVETRPLLTALLESGKTLLLPRCQLGARIDCVPVSNLDELSPGAYGILEPPQSYPAVDWTQVDFAVIPALACGENGFRLGQGGGYYDRFLSGAGCLSAALCLEEFLIPAVPQEEHDQPVGWIITQRRTLCFEKP